MRLPARKRLRYAMAYARAKRMLFREDSGKTSVRRSNAPHKILRAKRFCRRGVRRTIKGSIRFSFCLLSQQADGAVFDFLVLTTLLQRSYYTILFCGFVQPRSRNTPRFRLILPHFRLSRPNKRKRQGKIPCLFRLFLYPFCKTKILTAMAVPDGTGSVSTQ